MSLWVPQNKQETKQLCKLLKDPVEYAAVQQRQQDPVYLLELAKIKAVVLKAYSDAEQARLHHTNKRDMYATNGVTARVEQLAEQFQIPFWSIRTFPEQIEFPVDVQVREWGWALLSVGEDEDGSKWMETISQEGKHQKTYHTTYDANGTPINRSVEITND